MNTKSLRKLHRTLAPILFIPFFLTAFTGVAYRLGESWFGLSDNTIEWMMYIHQGSYLGPQLRSVYVLLNGLGLVGMLVSGIMMTSIFMRRSRPS